MTVVNLTLTKSRSTGAAEVVGQVMGQFWDQQNSDGSLPISTGSPGHDHIMTCSLSSGPDSAFGISLVPLSVKAPHVDITGLIGVILPIICR